MKTINFILGMVIGLVLALIIWNIFDINNEPNTAGDGTRFFAVSVEISCEDGNHSGVVGMAQAYGMYFNHDSLKTRLRDQYGDSCLIKILCINEMNNADFKDFMNSKN